MCEHTHKGVPVHSHRQNSTQTPGHYSYTYKAKYTYNTMNYQAFNTSKHACINMPAKFKMSKTVIFEHKRNFDAHVK